MAADEEPAKMSITDLSRHATLEAQFNPTEIGASVGVNYERLSVLGYTGTPLQWKGNENIKIPVELFLDRMADRGEGFDAARKFLWRLAYPVDSVPGDIIGSGPPDVLFVWPGLYSLVCRVTQVEEKFVRFTKAAKPTLAPGFKLSLEHFSSFRILGSDIEERGLEIDGADSGETSPTPGQPIGQGFATDIGGRGGFR